MTIKYTYKGVEHTVDGNTTTLTTSGKYCEDNISITSSGGAGYKPIDAGVIFVNYNGDELYSYTTAEAMNLTQLPPLPNNTGFKDEAWNWTLQQIKSYLTELPDNIVVVGVNLVTTDEKTHIFYEVDESNKNINLNINVNGTTTIDWGDGTPTVTLTGTSTSSSSGVKTANHVYANTGTYDITLSGGSLGFCKSSYVSRAGLINPTIASSETTNYKTYAVTSYLMGIKKIYLGKNFDRINMYGMGNMQGLEELSIPSTASAPSMTAGSFQNYSLQYCYLLKCVVLPTIIKNINNTVFYYLYNCKYVSMVYDTSLIAGNNFSYMYEIKAFTFPLNVTRLSSGSSFRTFYAPIKTNGKLTYIDTYFGSYNYSKTDNYNFTDKLTNAGSYFLAYTYTQTKIDLSMTKLATINAGSFMNSNAVEFILPSTLRTISASTFQNCFYFKRIKIPASVTSIGNTTFTNCYACLLYDFRDHTSIPTLGGTGGFTSRASNMKIVVPDSLYSTWRTTSNWSTFSANIVKASDYTGGL